MQPRCYRLNSETLGIVPRNNTPTLVTIPEGSTVTIADAKAGSRMINVWWEGQTVAIFTQDLDERGILEPEAKPRAGLAPEKSQSKTA